MENKEIFEKAIDALYYFYESEILFQDLRYNHPMFYNGTVSKNNSYQPPVPDKLMTKVEFIDKLEHSYNDDRWVTALMVLYNYILKQ